MPGFRTTASTTCATPSTRDLPEIGVIADVRKELMGHSGGGDVHSIYTHVEMPTLRDAIERLETWHAAKCRVLEEAVEADSPSPNRILTTEKEGHAHE